MAKKKQQIQHPPKEKEFHAAPFSALKGIPVSAAVPAEPIKPVTQKVPEASESGYDLFIPVSYTHLTLPTKRIV